MQENILYDPIKRRKRVKRTIGVEVTPLSSPSLELPEHEAQMNMSTENSVRKFWNNTSGIYKIDPESLHNFLGERGYRSYVPNGVKTTILIRIANNRAHEVSTYEIWNLCWEYIDTEYQFADPDERRQVKDVFHRSKSLFHKQNLSLLKPIDLNECKDTKDKSFLFFNDCYLEVRTASISVNEYLSLDGIVFETDISDFNLKPYLSTDQKTLDCIIPEGEFFEFLKDLTKNDNQSENANNLECLLTIIGYLIHRYKDPANAKAIIFLDTYKDGNPNGGTGKSLLTRGIGKVRETAFQDGKFFTSSDKFAFSNVLYGTRLLVIDDVPKNFDFEKIFPLITEKAVIERKYENKFIIPFDESPKVILTTNFTVEGSGSSHARRKIEFILSETYNSEYTPEDKFGHLLFIEWENIEWKKFYLLIVYCVQQFLDRGIIKPKFNLAYRKLKIEATAAFIAYVNKYVEVGMKLNKKTVYDDFYSKNPNHHRIELTTFRNWLKYFSDSCDFRFVETHSGNDNFFEMTME